MQNSMIGDPRFAPHNLHLDDPAVFRTMDPQLRELQRLPIAYRYPILAHLPVDQPGVYSITGGRRVGKSTVLKQWMADLLDAGVQPQRILYLTGELIDDHHALVSLLTRVTPDRSPALPAYLIVDEVTYIRDWDRGVKYLADAGLLDDVVLVLTGSDSVIIREARTRLPGRRGRAPRVDFHLYPLSFAEYLDLRDIADVGMDYAATLIDAFERYLVHGGFLTAINDMEAHGRILPATFAVYCDWIRGDMLKRGETGALPRGDSRQRHPPLRQPGDVAPPGRRSVNRSSDDGGGLRAASGPDGSAHRPTRARPRTGSRRRRRKRARWCCPTRSFSTLCGAGSIRWTIRLPLRSSR